MSGSDREHYSDEEQEQEQMIPELADFEGPYIKETYKNYDNMNVHDILNDPYTWPGDTIDIQPPNQMGRQVHRVKHGRDGKKTTKIIEDYYDVYSDPESDFENERSLRGFAAITRGENVVPQEADMVYYPFTPLKI